MTDVGDERPAQRSKPAEIAKIAVTGTSGMALLGIVAVLGWTSRSSAPADDDVVPATSGPSDQLVAIVPSPSTTLSPTTTAVPVTTIVTATAPTAPVPAPTIAPQQPTPAPAGSSTTPPPPPPPPDAVSEQTA